MPQVDAKLTSTIVLTLNLSNKEALLLQGMMQNSLVDPEMETTEEKNIRHALFNALSEVTVK